MATIFAEWSLTIERRAARTKTANVTSLERGNAGVLFPSGDWLNFPKLWSSQASGAPSSNKCFRGHRIALAIGACLARHSSSTLGFDAGSR
jgi:hypothetical protein